MKCEDARLLMNSVIDNEIESKQLSQLNDHLEHCESCTIEFEELKYVKELMGEIEMKELPLNFESELHTKLVQASLDRKSTSEEKRTEHGLSKLWNQIKGVAQHFKPRGSALALAFALVMIVFLSNNPFTQRYKMESAVSTEMAYDMTMAEPPMESFGAESRGEANFDFAEEAATDGMSDNAVVQFSSTAVAAPKAAVTGSGDLYRNERMIIKSAYVGIEITNYDEVINMIKDKVSAWAGYVENENTSKRDMYNGESLKYGSMTVRIPDDQFEVMMDEIKSYGNVLYDNSSANDITKNYRDTANEIENLKITEQRFREIMAGATEIKDILAIENELTRIRGSINQYERQLKDWEALVDLSSITIELNEVTSLEPVLEPIDKSLWGKAKSAFIETLNNIRILLENIFIWIVANSPIIIGVGLVTLIGYLIIRKRHKMKA